MSALFGSLGAYKVMPGVRIAYWGAVVHPWVAVGVGYGEISSSMATVRSEDGDDGLTAPDGSHIPAGESIHASLGSLGADVYVGVNIALGQSWNLVASVGYGVFKSLSGWEAKARNDADEEVSLGQLSGLPSRA